MSSIGSIIAGKYRITRHLGSGGMGSVYKAENVQIGRTVAVKVLHPHLADDEPSLARFHREAKTAASVAHRNLVEILDLGVESNGMPYLVMEYVRGRSLADVLSFEQRLEPSRACAIVGQVLAALAVVHAQGIIHRDLKPENVLLTHREGRADFVKVLDFGVAALRDDVEQVRDTRDLTPSGRVMGSPHYTCPEALRGRVGRDARVDLWSVGVMLYQMLVGVRPFASTQLDILCRSILDDEPAPFAAHGVSVPPDLEAVVTKALRKDPNARWQDAGAMLAALVPFGAEPLAASMPETTDTFTFDLRSLRERELVAQREAKSTPQTVGAEGLSGRFTLAARTVIRARHQPDVINQALGASKPEVHARFVGSMEPEGWYSDAWFDLLERLDVRYGRGDRKLLAEVGRVAARDGDPTLFRAPLPDLAFAKLPTIWSALFRTGRPSVESTGRAHGRFRVDAQPDARLARSIAFIGVLEECLRLSAGVRVDARLVKSVVLGDAFDRYEASWSYG